MIKVKSLTLIQLHTSLIQTQTYTDVHARVRTHTHTQIICLFQKAYEKIRVKN